MKIDSSLLPHLVSNLKAPILHFELTGDDSKLVEKVNSSIEHLEFFEDTNDNESAAIDKLISTLRFENEFRGNKEGTLKAIELIENRRR